MASVTYSRGVGTPSRYHVGRPPSLPVPANWSVQVDRHPDDLGVGEDVQVVTALGRELRHYRAFRSTLEPVLRVRRHGELLAGMEHDLAPGGVDAALGTRRVGLRVWRGLAAFDVEIDDAGSDAERLLLARSAIE